MKRKLSWHFYAVCLIVLNVAMAVTAFFIKDLEYSFEMLDLQAMRNAEISAKTKWNDDHPDTPKEYWYDAMLYSLIPADQPKPAPYGSGTRKRGGSVRYFTEKTGLAYYYDESKSYEGKILSVSFRTESGDPQIELKWVDAD